MVREEVVVRAIEEELKSNFNRQLINELKEYPNIRLQQCDFLAQNMLVLGQNQAVRYDGSEIVVCLNYLRDKRQLSEELARENGILEAI